MNFPVVYNVTSQIWVHLNDVEAESQLFQFSSIVDQFSLKICFPTEVTEGIQHIDIGVGMSEDSIESSLRFREAIQRVNMKYRPIMHDGNTAFFPNIKLEIAVRNIVGLLDNDEIDTINSTFSLFNPTILILTQVHILGGNILSMFKRYGYDRIMRLNLNLGGEGTYMLWRGSDVDLLAKDDSSITTIQFKAKCMEPWQKTVISKIDPNIRGFELWRYLEEYATVNYLPWLYLSEMKEVNPPIEETIEEMEEEA